MLLNTWALFFITIPDPFRFARPVRAALYLIEVFSAVGKSLGTGMVPSPSRPIPCRAEAPRCSRRNSCRQSALSASPRLAERVVKPRNRRNDRHDDGLVISGAVRHRRRTRAVARTVTFFAGPRRLL